MRLWLAGLGRQAGARRRPHQGCSRVGSGRGEQTLSKVNEVPGANNSPARKATALKGGQACVE